MKEIRTSSGRTIIIDDGDIDLVSRYSWSATNAAGGHFYAYARVPGNFRKKVSMHRLLMRPDVGMVVHHINNNGLDNRRANLVVTSQSANIRAAYEHRPTGAHLHKQTGKYRAQLRHAGKQISLGLFDDKAAAVEAVTKARATLGH